MYRLFQGDFFGFRGRVEGVTWKELLMGEEIFNEGGAGFSSII